MQSPNANPPGLELFNSLPRISQSDINELARNPLIIRFLLFWDFLSEGMSENSKRALLWETFNTIRAAFEAGAVARSKASC